MSDDVKLSRAIKQQAARAITAFDRAYYKEGGIRELEEKVNKAREGISTTIYNLVLSVRKKEKDLKQATATFRAACAYAEEGYKDEHGVDNVSTRIPSWGQFKSRILRAMRNGLDPAKFDSERALRGALRDKLAKSREVEEKKEAATNGRGKTEEPEQVEDFLEKTGIHETLKFAVSRIVIESEYIKPAKREEAEKILLDAAKALNRLIDRRRIKDDATKAALAMAA